MVGAFLQNALGMNPTRQAAGETLSFDVQNGGGGVLSAIQVARGFLESGQTRYAVVATSDSDAKGHFARPFPFSRCGGAVVLTEGPGGEGVVAQTSATFDAADEGARVTGTWTPDGRRGATVYRAEASAGYVEQAVRAARSVVETFLRQQIIQPAEISELIASQYPVGFCRELGETLGIPTYVETPSVGTRVPHTAAVIVGLEQARSRWSPGDLILVVTAAAGITIDCLLYRVPGRSAAGS